MWIRDINIFVDCHAEIISRRCLLEFLYKQLELFENGNPAPSSIFESNVSNVDGTVNGYKLKVSLNDLSFAFIYKLTVILHFCRVYEFDVHCILKENIRFHLYINTAPCGDARIFSPHETNVPGNREADTNGASTTKNVTTNNPSDVSKRYILWQFMLLIYILSFPFLQDI